MRKRDRAEVAAVLEAMFTWHEGQSDGYPKQAAFTNTGGGTGRGGHRILADLPPKRMRTVYRAYVALPLRTQQVLQLKYGHYYNGRHMVTDADRAAQLGVRRRWFLRLVAQAMDEILHQLRTGN